MITDIQIIRILKRYKFLKDINLDNCNLSNTDLRDSDLSYTFLRNANLGYAMLSNANLKATHLDYANLRSTNLDNANLNTAVLWNADLSNAYLLNADLRDADLRHANLTYTNLREAKLKGANLEGVNLYGTTLDKEEQVRFGIILKKDITTYKRCRDNLIVKLLIPKGSIVFAINKDSCRTNKAKVISISNIPNTEQFTKAKSIYNKDFIYEVGKGYEIEDFDLRYNVERTTGIHFFRTRKEAVNFGF